MGRGRPPHHRGDGAIDTDAPTYRWIDDQGDFDAFIADSVGAGTYALDTEFHRERTYFAQLALLQIGVGDQVVLVDPLAVEVAPLAALLDGPGTCLMHAASQDLEILERACGTLPRAFVDTQIAAGFVGLGSPGLYPLLARRIGVRLPKEQRLTDWLQRPLPATAARYAATDVEHLDDLWASLRAELDERGRLGWVLDECDRLRRRHHERAIPDQAWWRIKEARRLRGGARGVAQAVAAWRDQRAQHVDRPIRHVLPDLAVVAIAERPPRSRQDLLRMRGLDQRHLRGDAVDELLGAVQAGKALDDDAIEDPPRDGVDTSFRPAVTLASAWISQLARDQDLDASLVATRADIESLVRGDGTSRLLSGWRAEVAGLPVQRLLSGDAALAFAGEGRLVLEARSHRPPPGLEGDDIPALADGPSAADPAAHG